MSAPRRQGSLDPTSRGTGPRTLPLLLVDVDGVLSLYGGARAEPGTLLGTQVDGIPHLLPRGWPHVTFPEGPEPAAHWKLAGIDAFAGPERAMAWIDDGHDAACRDWAARRPGPTLLVTTEPDLGLTADHAAAVGEWARRSLARWT